MVGWASGEWRRFLHGWSAMLAEQCGRGSMLGPAQLCPLLHLLAAWMYNFTAAYGT